MRLFLSALLTTLIVPLAAYAQAPKQVEVINDPLAVEVVNPAPPSPPVRWQLVGFTSATYLGDMGGNFGVTQKCQLEFENSRMCTTIEVEQTTSIPSELVGQGRINQRADRGGLEGSNCGRWLVVFSGGGDAVDSHGTPGDAACDVLTPIACCALVP